MTLFLILLAIGLGIVVYAQDYRIRNGKWPDWLSMGM